jgi:hypothetical protein
MAFIVEFVPLKIHGNEGHGTVYAMEGMNKGQKIWEVAWYAPPYQVHLSNSGDRIVKVNTEAGRKRKSVLIEFYSQDGLFKQYKRKTIINNPKKIVWSTAGAHWVAEEPCIANYIDSTGNIFRIAAVDKSAFEFDLSTGEIIKEYRDSCAVNIHELSISRIEREEKEGKEIFDKIPNLNVFKESFNVTDINYNSKWPCRWSGRFYPIKTLPYKCMISFETIIDTNNLKALTFFTPQKFYDIIDNIYKKPYVKSILNSSKNYLLRLRLSGNSYNQNNFDLYEYIETMVQNNLISPPPELWVKFFIDYELENKNDKILSFYYPLETNILFSCVTNTMDNPIFKKKYQELCARISKEYSECILAIDTIGNFTVFPHLKVKKENDPCSKIDTSENYYELHKRNYFEVYSRKLLWHNNSMHQVLSYFGNPSEIIDLNCFEEKLFVYKNSYINNITFRNGYVIVAKANKQ